MNLQVLKWLIGCKNADMQLGFLLEIDFFCVLQTVERIF